MRVYNPVCNNGRQLLNVHASGGPGVKGNGGQSDIFSRCFVLVASSLIGQTLTSGTRQSSPDDVKPCLVQGRVTDSSTGEPVGQATLRLQLRSPSGESKSYLATSEADGTYK